ncbi:MAG: response regulator [Desulfatiglandales bacterium]
MGGRILIVDQDPFSRDSLRVLLEKRGHTVTALEDGYQISNVVESKDFDVIFLDSSTGGIRDKGIFAKIKSKCPRSHIILMTSKRGNGFIKEAMDAGVYGCIDKPFNPDEVLTMVRHIINT